MQFVNLLSESTSTLRLAVGNQLTSYDSDRKIVRPIELGGRSVNFPSIDLTQPRDEELLALNTFFLTPVYVSGRCIMCVR